MMTLKANCGCGWTRKVGENRIEPNGEGHHEQTYIPNPAHLCAVAEQHSQRKGHAVEIRGEIRP